MIRIRFKGSVNETILEDISGHLAAPQVFPAGIYGYFNANSTPTTNSILSSYLNGLLFRAVRFFADIAGELNHDTFVHTEFIAFLPDF